MSQSAVFDLNIHQSRPPFQLRVTLSAMSRVIAIQGPSGAGKSTLLRILAGVDRDATGSVRVGSETWQDDSPSLRAAARSGPNRVAESKRGRGWWATRRHQRLFVPPWERGVGWAPQGSLLFPHLDVRHNLAYGGAEALRVAEMADMLEIGALLPRDPSGLSGGERQRVALGRALLSARTLLLLDEPFSALDPDLRQGLAERVARWASDSGLPVVIVTHDLDDLGGFTGERWRLVRGEAVRIEASTA